MTALQEHRLLSASVVVCAYTEKRWDDLVASVNSLLAQDTPPDEVIVVVDFNDALLARLVERFPDITVIPNTMTKGLSGARNTGVARSSCEVVAFLDDDAAAEPGWLTSLLAAYGEPQVAGVGGLVVPRWSNERPGWFPPLFDWVVGCCHSGMPAERAQVRNFVGANMSFKRSVLVELGGFQSSLGRVGENAAGCEETELCIRAAAGDGSRRRPELVYEPSAVVHHHVPKARTTASYFLRRCYGEGRSKALVSRVAGRDQALSSERRYLASTLPRALAHCLFEVATGHPFGLLEAAAAMTGTAATLAGYAAVSLRRPREAPARRQARHLLSDLWSRGELFSVLALALALSLWLVVLLHGVALSKMNDFGLVSVLPFSYWLAVALTVASMAWWLRRRAPSEIALGAHVVVLLAMFHLTPTVLYKTLRYSWAWKHVGITDTLIANHGVNLHQQIPALVAYQDWPGFFSLNALLTSASGFTSALSYASWGPFVNELLYLGPLLLIFRAFTNDKRVQWCAVLIFYLGNWVGQDYFSPQAFAFFLYLVVIAFVLQHLSRRQRTGSPAAAFVEPREHGERRVLVVLLLVLMATIASSHQLTPFMVVSALACLAVVRRLSVRFLLFASVVFAFGWTLTAGHTFVVDNAHSLFASFGDFGSNASLQQVNDAYASHGQLVVAEIDRLLTAAIILLAGLGTLRRLSRRFLARLLPAMALVAASVIALAGNNYGGEIVFRVVLFALPFLSILAALALFSTRSGSAQALRRAVGSLTRSLVLLGLLVGFLFSYYGKEAGNYFSPAETATLSSFYAQLPKGAYLTGLAGNFPGPTEHYFSYTTYWFTQVSPEVTRDLIRAPVRTLVSDMSFYKHSYVMFVESDTRQIEMTGLMPRSSIPDIERAVAHSSRFVRIVHSATTTIYALRAPGS